ncbi:hypothetical protein BJ994_000232 [Arthrobacter pigmenti]|uniref:Uncharacterized protein n=1 Tax=Arthrobacter pigmenti TaxID=271432 RepID=A0A846RPX2_9MICC|nr:hypothetical protein [Arthrobacter pigmenti]
MARVGTRTLPSTARVSRTVARGRGSVALILHCAGRAPHSARGSPAVERALRTGHEQKERFQRPVDGEAMRQRIAETPVMARPAMSELIS